ncbi:MAG: homoserine dehydrogenase [Clostridia bacterium]|nr:homoserine dehydrogenase [Clostridia bacterium]MEE1184512.1 homoserine dehydrogenase [Acutalibacteraceae bacterium]
MIDIALMGHGVVGSGVAEIIINHAERINNSCKNNINIKYILDLRKFDNLPYSDKFITDFSAILEDNDIRIVVEVMGGVNPAYEFVRSCLLAGKSVVTSNKELVAAKGAELIKIARDKNVNFLFEASVGGGIPVLRPLVQCLAANEIKEINGILNGTTNYILNKMIVDNMDFETALKLAQENGYAEKNPAADIEGHDACRKVCILAALAFGKHVYPEQVSTEGITNISLDDIDYADKFNYVIKLIGSAKKLPDGKISASVRPTLVRRDNILSNVDGVFNAIMVNGDQTGDVLFYGKGAGKEATASAVVADIIDCAKHLDSRKYLYWDDGNDDYVDNNSTLKSKLYICVKSNDVSDVKSQIKKLFGDDIFIITNEFKNELAFLTNTDFEDSLYTKANQLKSITDIKILHTL